jgi:hypothetical protein
MDNSAESGGLHTKNNDAPAKKKNQVQACQRNDRMRVPRKSETLQPPCQQYNHTKLDNFIFFK